MNYPDFTQTHISGALGLKATVDFGRSAVANVTQSPPLSEVVPISYLWLSILFCRRMEDHLLSQILELLKC
jgi:hypothetical protein